MARTFETAPEVLKELEQDENILWKGAPEAFPLVNADNKKSLMIRWIGCVVAAIVLIIGYIILAGKADTNPWLIFVVLAVVLYLAASPLLDRKNVYKGCKYYVSDRRVLLHYADKEIYSLPLNGLKQNILAAEKGCVHVELGSCAGMKAAKRRAAAFVPKKNDNGDVIGMGIYNVEESAELNKLFS